MTLETLRTSVGRNPSFVADKLDISYRQFHRIEKGEGYLTKERAKILAKLYGVKMSEILSMYGGKVNG